MLIQPLTDYEEPLTRCLKTIFTSRQEKIHIESTLGFSYCNQWSGFGKASNNLIVLLIQFSDRNASIDRYVRLHVLFLLSVVFSISFLFFAYAFPVVSKCNEIRGTGVLKGILNCPNQKKKKICTFNLLSLTGLHYIQCVFKGWCIVSTVQETLQFINSTSKIIRLFLIFTVTVTRRKTIVGKSPFKIDREKRMTFPQIYCVFKYTIKKSHLIPNGKMDCFCLPWFAARRCIFLT